VQLRDERGTVEKSQGRRRPMDFKGGGVATWIVGGPV
jgi:hypothetical protein